MTKGFIVYALGHRNYYHMAETLAASLLVNNAAVKISVICDNPENILQKQLFDQIITVQVESPLIFNNHTVRMYDHSPYDLTIKIDADLIWLNGRDPLKLFDDLEQYDVMHMNRGHGWSKGNSVWVNEYYLRTTYDFNLEHKLYKIYGEFVYFKKGAKAKQYFKTVKQVYNKPKVKMDDAFANGTFTDELAYQIASMMLDMEYIEDYTPVFNKYLGHKKFETMYAYQLPNTFYGYSIGGNTTSPFMRDQYNILAKHYYHQLGLQNPYQVRDKKSFLPERIKR